MCHPKLLPPDFQENEWNGTVFVFICAKDVRRILTASKNTRRRLGDVPIFPRKLKQSLTLVFNFHLSERPAYVHVAGFVVLRSYEKIYLAD